MTFVIGCVYIPPSCEAGCFGGAGGAGGGDDGAQCKRNRRVFENDTTFSDVDQDLRSTFSR